MIEKLISKWLPLATAPILGQPPDRNYFHSGMRYMGIPWLERPLENGPNWASQSQTMNFENGSCADSFL